MILKGIFYLKNGLIIEEFIEYKEDTPLTVLQNALEEAREGMKKAIRTNDLGSITFGFTTFRFSEIAAVKFYDGQ